MRGRRRFSGIRIIGREVQVCYQGEWRLIEREGSTQTEGTAEQSGAASLPIVPLISAQRPSSANCNTKLQGSYAQRHRDTATPPSSSSESLLLSLLILRSCHCSCLPCEDSEFRSKIVIREAAAVHFKLGWRFRAYFSGAGKNANHSKLF